MSWLFDRLTDLAVADHLEIVVDIRGDGDLETILRRAALLPGTGVSEGQLRPAQDRPPGVARFVASGTTRAPLLFAGLGEHDLGVSLAADVDGASMRVDRLDELSSLLDALVTMRAHVHRVAV